MSVFTNNSNPTPSTSSAGNQNFKLGNNITNFFSTANSAPLAAGQIFQSKYPLSMAKNFFAKSEPQNLGVSSNFNGQSFVRPSLFNERTEGGPSDSDVIFGNQTKDLYNPDAFKQPPVQEAPAEQATEAIEKPVLAGSAVSEGINLSFDTPSGMMGLGIGALDTAITSNINQSNLIAARQGNGPGGHAFDAVNHAEANANFNSVNSTIQSALIAGGSAFGPEGLVAGMALAGVEEGVAQVFSPSINTTQGLNGDMVSDLDQ